MNEYLLPHPVNKKSKPKAVYWFALSLAAAFILMLMSAIFLQPLSYFEECQLKQSNSQVDLYVLRIIQSANGVSPRATGTVLDKAEALGIGENLRFKYHVGIADGCGLVDDIRAAVTP